MQTEKTNILFVRLGNFYGAAWKKPLENDYDYNSALKDWAVKIEQLSVDELNFGLEKCFKRKNTYPPNYVEFYKLCSIEPEDINIKRDWQLSLMTKDDMYEEISNRIKTHVEDRNRRDYEKIYKSYYEMMVDKKITDINHNRQLKAEIINRICGSKQFLLTAN